MPKPLPKCHTVFAVWLLIIGVDSLVAQQNVTPATRPDNSLLVNGEYPILALSIEWRATPFEQGILVELKHRTQDGQGNLGATAAYRTFELPGKDSQSWKEAAADPVASLRLIETAAEFIRASVLPKNPEVEYAGEMMLIKIWSGKVNEITVRLPRDRQDARLEQLIQAWNDALPNSEWQIP